MTLLLLAVFIAGYLCIAFERRIGIDKAGSALITGVVCWMIFGFSGHFENAGDLLAGRFSEIASILFFLVGAMTIVELIASHDGFTILVSRIRTTSKVKILWLISIITFFLSAFLDNLTTAIVMTSMTARILEDKNDRLWFSGMIIIAANAGGAWSPLGDVTTTMLWIGHQVTPAALVGSLLFPCFAVILVPLIILSVKFKNSTVPAAGKTHSSVRSSERNTILFSGMGLLLFVPVFAMITHLPPFMGMMLAVGMLWIITSLIHQHK